MAHPKFLPTLPWLIVCLAVAGAAVRAQGNVGLLRTGTGSVLAAPVRTVEGNFAERFTLDRNLIFFHASRDGRPGSYVLDTGAPSLVLNHRGRGELRPARVTGIGAGGAVELTDHYVDRFEMGGRSVSDFRAVGVDLRTMEIRTDRRIDGFVGFELINGGELRIDYGAQRFELLPSVRHPRHAGKAPRAVLRFSLIDHLPVVRLRINGKRYAFAIDTGAGCNLIDRRLLERGMTIATGDRMNIQGLDGQATDHPLVVLPAPDDLPAVRQELTLVSVDMSDLQTPGTPRLSGILGSAFLRDYTVGIDYRRRRLYLW